MGLLKTLILYFSTLAICFGIDLIWLGLMNSRFYKAQLAGLMSDKVNWLPAILFYLLFVIGFVIIFSSLFLEDESETHSVVCGTDDADCPDQFEL